MEIRSGVRKKRKKRKSKKADFFLKNTWEVGNGNIYLFWANNQYTLTMTFLRVQEFYESSLIPIRGRKFDLEKYMDLYAEKFGNFTYTDDWAGFNIPDIEFAKFFKMYNAAELSRKETNLLKMIGPAIKEYYMSKKRFCVIGAYRNEDIPHEVAHGMFHLDPEYRKETTKLVKKWKHHRQFGKIMMEMGYSNTQFIDECQAYLATSTRSFLRSQGYPDEWDLPKEFKKSFRNYIKKWGINLK